MRKYGKTDAALAAFAGAVVNAALLELYIVSQSWLGIAVVTLAFFSIGLTGLLCVGLPLVRWLAQRQKDTVLVGFLCGSAIGALAGGLTAIAIFVSVTDGEWAPTFADPDVSRLLALLFAALFGLPLGIADGAVAGIVLVWLGRWRESGGNEGLEPQ